MKSRGYKLLSSGLCPVILSLLIACGGGSTEVPDEPEDEIFGKLTIDLTDAPIDSATEVVVSFTAIELKPQSGPSIEIEFEEPKSIDLLALQNGETEPLLDGESLEAGTYNWVRLMVDADESEMDSYIAFEDGSTYSLHVPSGSQSGLKLNNSFVIPAGGSADLTIDFDLRKSIVAPSGNSDEYKLKPVLRIVDNSAVGEISGTIAALLVTDESCEEGLAVYVYQGSDVSGDDEGSATPPVTSVMPEYSADDDSYHFTLAFMAEGDYTLGVTCDADNDDPEADESEEDWSILAATNASVTVGETTIVSFE